MKKVITISQETIMNFLKENPDDWFTVRELSKELSLGLSSVDSNVKRLRKSHLIHYQWNDRRGYYKHKGEGEI